MATFTYPQYSAYASGMNGGNVSVVDSAPIEMLHLIDPHWYKYPPMNPIWFNILGLLIGTVGIVSCIGNGIVIYIFTMTKNLRTPSNLLVVNLALSDFLMLFTMAPPMAYNCYNETWMFGPLMCDLYALCGSQFGCVSIWTMTMIACDRYNVIVKGLAGKPLTNGGALLQIAFIWLFSAMWTFFPLFGWNRYVPEGNMTACGTDYLSTDWLSRSYILAYSIFVYYTPLLTICYSYYFILKAVSAHEKVMREQAKKMNVASLRSSDDGNKSSEAKLAKVALMTITLWFIAWTPYLVINYAGIFGAKNLPPLGTIWGSVFGKCNAVYNPIVYGISHPKYRAALSDRIQSIVCCVKKSKTENESTVSGVTGVCEQRSLEV